MTTIQDLITEWARGISVEAEKPFIHHHLGITWEQWRDLVKYGAGGHEALDKITVRSTPCCADHRPPGPGWCINGDVNGYDPCCADCPVYDIREVADES